MEMTRLLAPARVVGDSPVSSKKRALEELSALLAKDTPSISARAVFDGLIERERLGSTGLGHGVALPHARLGNVAAPIGAFLRLSDGVDFDAIDDQPVTLLFGLLVPEESTEEHLRVLAGLAQMFRDTAFCDRLRNTAGADALMDLLSGWRPPASSP